MKELASELRKRDGALIDNWYIACASDDLTSSRPIGRMIYDIPLVLYRLASGEVTCIPDRCLHRAAKLSEGRMVAGGVACPYHGWVYGAQGRVIEIPSTRCTHSFQLSARPCFEQDGYVWVWMGDRPPDLSQTKPPWRFPRQKGLGWVHYRQSFEFEGDVLALVQNFTDVPHSLYVHRGLFRRPRGIQVPMAIKVESGHVECDYRQDADKIGFFSRAINPFGASMIHKDHFYMPNITHVEYWFGQTSAMLITSQCTPVTKGKTVLFTEFLFRIGIMTPLLKPILKAYTAAVIKQDVRILAAQRDNIQRCGAAIFTSTTADKMHNEIEKLRIYGVKGSNEWRNYKISHEAEIWI